MKFVEDLNTHDTSVGQLYPTEDGIWSGMCSFLIARR